MSKSRAIRRLLNDLAALGLLVDYSLHMRFGQSVMVYNALGQPVVMRLGTARQYAREVELARWWGG